MQLQIAELSSKKDADLVEKETLPALSAHRDFLRRFLHDVATPLSAVSLHLEAADRRVRRGADPSDSLAVARAEISRAFDLFDRGRELLLFDPAAQEPVAFDELVSAAVSRLGAAGVTLEGSTGGFVRGDRGTLAEAVEALLCNALEASAGSAVTVELGRNAGGLRLRVWNRGLLPDDPDGLFSPRAAAPGKAWGMGLARARVFSAAAGGAVRLEQSGDRVVATLELPEERP
jgi:signal transduction histidine kinase